MSAKALLSASVSAPPAVYVEDVFSTWLYTGNSSTQTITNGIDLSGKGGLTWIKGRSGATGHRFTDTARGATKSLESNSTAAEATESTGLTSFSSTGFVIGADADYNDSAATYCSWTFRKAAKFFDVVTYTGNGVSGRQIPHNLGSMPGIIIVKCTSASANWVVWHRSLSANRVLFLNTTAAEGAGTSSVTGYISASTSSDFTVSSGYSSALAGVNASGGTYVAYLFAHDTSADGLIQCGSYTGGGVFFGSLPQVTLGWEPQYLMIKRASSTSNWQIIDNMRGMPVGSSDATLQANLSSAESSVEYVSPTATGFDVVSANSEVNSDSNTYIYIAIRRGPMKTPTVGTSVFGLNARSGTGANATVTGGQVDDAVLIKNRGSAVGDLFASRLTGTGYLETSSTAVEVAAGTTILQANPWDVMDGVKVGTTSTITNASGNTFVNYLFRRAPGFFDVVAYTGTGYVRTVNHNLGVAPELMIVKSRSLAGINWWVYNASLGSTKYLVFNETGAAAPFSGAWNDTQPTSSYFTVGTHPSVNDSGSTYVAYLFATLAGVSKVGSYTGTGTTKQIDCGFTAGARFVLIKRTDSTGAWYVWDTARGIISGSDPFLLLNSTAAEVTGTDYIDPLSSGFEISSTAPSAINANGGSYIFLSIA